MSARSFPNERRRPSGQEQPEGGPAHTNGTSARVGIRLACIPRLCGPVEMRY